MDDAVQHLAVEQLDQAIGIDGAARLVRSAGEAPGTAATNDGIDELDVPRRIHAAAARGVSERVRIAEPVRPDALVESLTEFDVGLVISDSFGRPWRLGTTNVAIGCDGVPALWDRRGEQDRQGRALEVTQVAFADAIAAAAGLVMGEARESVPCAIVRGLHWTAPDRPARDLIRPLEEDLFR